MLQIPDPENEVAIRLHDVVRCLIQVDRRAASAQLAPLAGVTCVTHPIDKLPVRARGDWTVGSGTMTRSPPRRIIAMVYVRDSFTCRYSRRWTVPTQILRLISVAFPFHPNWQRDVVPRAYWDISTSLAADLAREPRRRGRSMQADEAQAFAKLAGESRAGTVSLVEGLDQAVFTPSVATPSPATKDDWRRRRGGCLCGGWGRLSRTQSRRRRGACARLGGRQRSPSPGGEVRPRARADKLGVAAGRACERIVEGASP